MAMDASELVYIGLGSNLDEPARHVLLAVQQLHSLPLTRLLRSSSLYTSRPMGPADQPDYVNAVAEMQTTLDPVDLLDFLQTIERNHGRDRNGNVRWGPRPLDLDILLYGRREVATPRLTIPHPGIAERAFVLLPLAELSPVLQIPGLPAVSELLAQCDSNGAQRLRMPVEGMNT